MHASESGACPVGGGGQAIHEGPKGPAPPPLEIENLTKINFKKSPEQILSYFTYILLLFLVSNIVFSAMCAPPP